MFSTAIPRRSLQITSSAGIDVEIQAAQDGREKSIEPSCAFPGCCILALYIWLQRFFKSAETLALTGHCVKAIVRSPISTLDYDCPIDSNLSCVFPIRLEAIVAVESGTETGICHVGPVILIEAGCVFKAALGYVKDKLLVDAIDLQRLPWYGKQLIPHLEKAAKGQNGIGDAAGM